jgi:hypothetical protein
MQAVAAWKKSQGIKPEPKASSGGDGSAKRSGVQDTDPLEGIASAASVRTLEGIRDDPNALRSDRIRAAEALLRVASAQASSGGDEAGQWLAMRDALMVIPPADALGYLLGALGEDANDAHPLEGEEAGAHEPMPSS